MIPIRAINRSTELWGPDAQQFRPERWLNGEAAIPDMVKEFQGYHHLLTFVDGQRICLGRGFAVAEFKVRSIEDIDVPQFAYDDIHNL